MIDAREISRWRQMAPWADELIGRSRFRGCLYGRPTGSLRDSL